MQNGQKQVVLGKGEKERERRKEKRKRKKEEKKEKKRRKRERKRKKGGKKGGGSKQKSKAKKTKTKTKQNMEKYLLILYTLSPLTSPGTCPSSWSSGGGACCADFQVLALGGAAQPLPGAGLSE